MADRSSPQVRRVMGVSPALPFGGPLDQEQDARNRALVDAFTRGGLRTLGPTAAAEVAGMRALAGNVGKTAGYVADVVGPAVEEWWKLDGPLHSKDPAERAYYEARRRFETAVPAQAPAYEDVGRAAEGGYMGMKRRLIADAVRYPDAVIGGERIGQAASPINWLADTLAGKKSDQYLDRMKWTEAALNSEPMGQVPSKLPVAPAQPAPNLPRVALSDVALAPGQYVMDQGAPSTEDAGYSRPQMAALDDRRAASVEPGSPGPGAGMEIASNGRLAPIRPGMKKTAPQQGAMEAFFADLLSKADAQDGRR